VSAYYKSVLCVLPPPGSNSLRCLGTPGSKSFAGSQHHPEPDLLPLTPDLSTLSSGSAIFISRWRPIGAWGSLLILWPVVEDRGMEAKVESLGSSLLEAFRGVPDPRSRHGRRHPLPAILSLATSAMLCGCNSLYAIAQWGREHPELAPVLGFDARQTP
jgi:hypothetical protein